MRPGPGTTRRREAVARIIIENVVAFGLWYGNLDQAERRPACGGGQAWQPELLGGRNGSFR